MEMETPEGRRLALEAAAAVAVGVVVAVVPGTALPLGLFHSQEMVCDAPALWESPKGSPRAAVPHPTCPGQPCPGVQEDPCLPAGCGFCLGPGMVVTAATLSCLFITGVFV